MSELAICLKALDSCIFELGEAFTDFPDADLWTRPHPRLLSVGELACHMCRAEANYFSPSLESPLFVDQARYYPYSIETPTHVDLSASQVYEEMKRVHAACRAALEALNPDLASQNPHREGWTWGYSLEYQAFHLAYHTGQIYSVRHMMGHETPDN
jgi:uncharacterized damage-inducible protein DinB